MSQNELRELAKKWRGENGDYPESKCDCADELDALLDAAPALAFPAGGRSLRISARQIWNMGLAGCSVRLLRDAAPSTKDDET